MISVRNIASSNGITSSYLYMCTYIHLYVFWMILSEYCIIWYLEGLSNNIRYLLLFLSSPFILNSVPPCQLESLPCFSMLNFLSPVFCYSPLKTPTQFLSIFLIIRSLHVVYSHPKMWYQELQMKENMWLLESSPNGCIYFKAPTCMA